MKLEHEIDQILAIWKAAEQHMETNLKLKVHEGWKNQFDMLRTARNKGDKSVMASMLLQIACLFKRARDNPKSVEEFSEEFLKP